MSSIHSAALILALAAPALARATDGPAETPNVVLIFVDDVGWADIGVQGAQGFETPNLDRMAAEGVRMTDFYVSQPVCSASRASLLTGCYANRVGISGALGPSSGYGIADAERTLAELCRGRGYATALFGKWHLGHHPQFLPTRHGFDTWYGLPYSNDMWPYHPDGPRAYADLPTMENDSVLAWNGDQTNLTEEITRRSVEFIDRHARERFFLYVPHPMAHVPLHASKPFQGSSKQGAYGDVMQELDASVGRILAALRRNRIDEDTLVIFTSDNGPWLSYGDHAGSTGPLREGKGTTFEGGVRVPFLARWPGHIPAGTVCSEPASTMDVFPTVAAVLRAPLSDLVIDGQDIWPLLLGREGARSPHEALFFYYHQNNLEAMRSGRWKLHFPHTYRTMAGREMGGGGKPGEYDYGAKVGLALYDLEADVGETTDVAAEHPEVVERLQAMAEEMRRELGDKLTSLEGSANREPGRLSGSD